MSKRKSLRIPMVTISSLFVVLMLILPLASVIVNSLSKGWEFYAESL